MRNEQSIEERQAALRDYLAEADDQAAALAWIRSALDPSTDATLLAWIDEEYSQAPAQPPQPTLHA